jgi:hypothetical protein
MTKQKRPISVRLDAGIEAVLDSYCIRAGVTRSHAVNEGMAQYLASRVGPTLSSLAEQILPPMPPTAAEAMPRAPRQQRYRERVREKRRR